MIDCGFGFTISNVGISTAFGHSGGGMFPYTLRPAYRMLMHIARKTKTSIIAKSATRFSRQGNFNLYDWRTWKYVQRISGTQTGMLNAYGLTNDGVEIEASRILKAWKKGLFVIPNFFPEFAKGEDAAIRETLEAIEIYRRILGYWFWIMEINYSCPNSEGAPGR